MYSLPDVPEPWSEVEHDLRSDLSWEELVQQVYWMVQKTWNWLLLWCWLCQQSLLNLCTTYIRSHFTNMKSQRGVSKPYYYTTSPHHQLRWAAASWEKSSVGIWPCLCRVLAVKHSSKGRWRAAAQRTCVISNWKHVTHGSSSFLFHHGDPRRVWRLCASYISNNLMLGLMCVAHGFELSYSFYKHTETEICSNIKTMNTTVNKEFN